MDHDAYDDLHQRLTALETQVEARLAVLKAMVEEQRAMNRALAAMGVRLEARKDR